jgi:hypothetical protein
MLKGNANPLIVGVNRKWRGNSIDVVGKKLRDVLPLSKREILAVEVEVEFKGRKYKGKQSRVKRKFRLVCIFNSESGKYNTYFTIINYNRSIYLADHKITDNISKLLVGSGYINYVIT